MDPVDSESKQAIGRIVQCQQQKSAAANY